MGFNWNNFYKYPLTVTNLKKNVLVLMLTYQNIFKCKQTDDINCQNVLHANMTETKVRKETKVWKEEETNCQKWAL